MNLYIQAAKVVPAKLKAKAATLARNAETTPRFRTEKAHCCVKRVQKRRGRRVSGLLIYFHLKVRLIIEINLENSGSIARVLMFLYRFKPDVQHNMLRFIDR